MLALVNVSESRGIPYGKGEQVYELRINRRVLCEVRHNYEDGAEVLLRKAADALHAAGEAQQPCGVKLPRGDALYKAILARSDQIMRGENLPE